MKNNLKSFMRFCNANKIDNLNIGEGGRERKKQKSKAIYRTSQNIVIHVYLESLLSQSFPLLGITVCLTSFGYFSSLC